MLKLEILRQPPENTPAVWRTIRLTPPSTQNTQHPGRDTCYSVISGINACTEVVSSTSHPWLVVVRGGSEYDALKSDSFNYGNSFLATCSRLTVLKFTILHEDCCCFVFFFSNETIL